MKIVFATGNSGKLREAQEILGEGFELVTPAALGVKEDIPETGGTIAANSYQKAKYIKDHCGADSFADDTGLEVEILGGAPGVHTARYAGEDKDFDNNMNKILEDMAMAEEEASMAREFGIDTVHANRKARFVTVVTLILNGEMHTFEGVMKGKIRISKAGKGGFGYDPVFVPDEILQDDGTIGPNVGRLTAAEMTEEQKNAISHRGKALRAMADYLHSLVS